MAPRNKVFAYRNPAFEAGELQTTSVPRYDRRASEEDGGSSSVSVGPMPALVDEIEDLQVQGILWSGGGEKLLVRMRWQYWAVCCLVLTHILLIGWTDPLDTSSRLVQVLLFLLHAGLLIAIAMAFFLLTSQTLMITLGRYDLYLQHFKLLYGTFVVELALMVGLKVYQTILMFDWVSHTGLWSAGFQGSAFKTLWMVHRVTLLFFWVLATHQAGEAFQPNLYDPAYLAAKSHR